MKQRLRKQHIRTTSSGAVPSAVPGVGLGVLNSVHQECARHQGWQAAAKRYPHDLTYDFFADPAHGAPL